MSKLVRKTLADSPMTSVRKRKLAQLAARPDSEIDFSEIPPLKESFWKNAVRNPYYRAGQAAADGAPGRRCGGLAPPAREGLSDQAQPSPPESDGAGDPYDNATWESFMKTLKCEEVYRQEYRDLAEARTSIDRFLEKTYNGKRLHSALGYRPPVEFECSLSVPADSQPGVSI